MINGIDTYSKSLPELGFPICLLNSLVKADFPASHQARPHLDRKGFWPMRLRQRLLSMSPWVGTLIFLAALLGGRLILNWAVSRVHPNLHFWSAASQFLGTVPGSVVASAVVYLLLRSRRKQ